MTIRFFVSLMMFVFVSLQAPCFSFEIGIEHLESLRKERKWKEIVAALKQEDLSTIAASMGQEEDLLYCLRAEAHRFLKDGPAAEADFKRAIEKGRRNGASSRYWHGLADNRRDNLKDFPGALEAYLTAAELCFQAGNRNGFMPIQCSIDAAGIYRNDGKYEEALSLLRRYESLDGLAPVWKVKVLRAFAEVYLGQGKEEAAADCFQRASAIENEAKSGSH